jgi:hypothetical protein
MARNKYVKLDPQQPEQGGYSVHAAPTGWVIEQWGQVQGELTDRKVLLPYHIWGPYMGIRTLPPARAADLYAPDAPYTIAEQLESALNESGNPPPYRILRRGHIVQ